ncbi:hypothetical protein COHA_000582 [Chlorella ohadii]|uniref:Ferredoxin thioredoxin reductase alpha chain domain-containing protein n=1 Tax=Chlorella ohadii TaxID=2649997 RepID=A0AAD5E060_9CHLO|nr:hypothetical protein COHA_000582 [Chlorella ohadii]
MQATGVQARPVATVGGRRTATRAASSNGARPVAALEAGSRIRVTAPVKVYHVAKFKEGLDLQGREATVLKPDVRDYKHHDGKKHELSANLPVQVQFQVDGPDGKVIKVLAHLAEDEIEAL